jgi:hypothetical protein
MDIIFIISVGVAWIWPSSWPMRIWWPRPPSSQGMTIRKYLSRNRTRIGLEIEASLEFTGFNWKQCFGSAKDADADPAPGIQCFISMRIRLRGSSFYLNADPDPGIQHFTSVRSRLRGSSFTSMRIRICGHNFCLNADPDPGIQFLP